MSEACESKVANLLAGMDNLPELGVNGRIKVLVKCIEQLEREIHEHERLKPTVAHGSDEE